MGAHKSIANLLSPCYAVDRYNSTGNSTHSSLLVSTNAKYTNVCCMRTIPYLFICHFFSNVSHDVSKFCCANETISFFIKCSKASYDIIMCVHSVYILSNQHQKYREVYSALSYKKNYSLVRISESYPYIFKVEFYIFSSIYVYFCSSS